MAGRPDILQVHPSGFDRKAWVQPAEAAAQPQVISGTWGAVEQRSTDGASSPLGGRRPAWWAGRAAAAAAAGRRRAACPSGRSGLPADALPCCTTGVQDASWRPMLTHDCHIPQCAATACGGQHSMRRPAQHVGPSTACGSQDSARQSVLNQGFELGAGPPPQHGCQAPKPLPRSQSWLGASRVAARAGGGGQQR